MKPETFFLLLVLTAVGFWMVLLPHPHLYAAIRPPPKIGEIYASKHVTPFKTSEAYARVDDVKDGWVKWSYESKDDYLSDKSWRSAWEDEAETHVFYYCYPTKVGEDSP